MGGRTVDVTDILYSECAPESMGHQIVILGCGNGVLAAWIGINYPEVEMVLSDISYLALECSRLTLNRNGVKNAVMFPGHCLLPEYQNCFDTAILVLGKGRKLARRQLVEVFHLLLPKGKLIIAGSNDLGIQSIVRDAEDLFQSFPKVLGYKKGHRIVQLEKQALATIPSWCMQPGIAPGSWHRFSTQIGESFYQIFSLPGVFSYDQIDEGTNLLLKTLPLDLKGHILDVGCGYGILALAIASLCAGKFNRDTAFDLVDVNLLAVASAQKTIQTNQLSLPDDISTKFRIFPGDLMDNLVDSSYDVVVSNPPFHTGKNVDYATSRALIQQAHRSLTPKGILLIVANRFIRYEKWMDGLFKTVEIINQNSRYHIILGQHPI